MNFERPPSDALLSCYTTTEIYGFIFFSVHLAEDILLLLDV